MTKKALYALAAQGVDICGGMTIKGGHDMFIGDGSAITSMVKDAEFVGNLFVDAEGEPNFDAEGNNVDAGHGEKAFLRLTRNWGDVVYKAVKGVDDLLLPDDGDDKVESLPEVKAQLDKLSQAIDTVVNSMRIGREVEVTKLDNSFDNFLVTLQASLEELKTEILDYASAKDIILMAKAMEKINKTEECYELRVSRDRFCLSAQIAEAAQGLDAEVYSIPQENGSLDSMRGNVSLWDVRVHLHKTGEDEHIRSADIAHVLYTDGDKLKCNIDLETCPDHALAQDRIVITGVYAGPDSDLDDACEQARDQIAPDFSGVPFESAVFVPNYNSTDHPGTLATAESEANKISRASAINGNS